MNEIDEEAHRANQLLFENDPIEWLKQQIDRLAIEQQCMRRRTAPPEFYCKCGRLYDVSNEDGLQCSVCLKASVPQGTVTWLDETTLKYDLGPQMKELLGIISGVVLHQDTQPEPEPRICSICKQPIRGGWCACI